MIIRKNLIHKPSKGFDCVTPSRTVQEFKDECDVNTILRNYVDYGVLTHVNRKAPVFGDFSQIPADYGEALDLINRSNEEFMNLPSNVRDKFDNQPRNLIKFLQNPANRKEAEELGLVDKQTKPDS